MITESAKMNVEEARESALKIRRRFGMKKFSVNDHG